MDNYHRNVKSIKLITDGDTFTCTVDLGYGVSIEETYRFAGINAYETTRRGSWDNDLTKEEIDAHLDKGKQARARVRELLKEYAVAVWVVSSKPDKFEKGKYGRYLGTIWIKDGGGQSVNVNKLLVDEGLAYYKEY